VEGELFFFFFWKDVKFLFPALKIAAYKCVTNIGLSATIKHMRKRA